MISLANAVLIRGQQVLLDDASLVIHKGQKIGIIGRNGSGKTSLFACLRGELTLDSGSLKIPDGLRMAYMRQEFSGSQRSALDFVVDGDGVFRATEAALQAAEAANDHAAITHLHSELDAMGAYDITTRAAQLLAGLGFSVPEFDKPVAAFSGGWRIRLNLAAALMSPSDLLMLDEPTNHLDLEATLWLEQWLVRYPGTLLVISHDRDFLDRIIDSVVSFESRRLYTYKGNFSAYEVQRAERLAQQQAMYDKQQRRRAEIEDFVRRFRYKATKARQAQSRLKELARMEAIALAHVDSPFEFGFPEPENLPDYLLTTRKLAIGFDTELVRDIDLTIQSVTRMGLLGFNGCGKSTLLKVLAGMLPPLRGEVSRSKVLKVGYFAQHQVDVLDLTASPLEVLQRLSPLQREQDLRDYLGGYDFVGARVQEKIGNFSGGEKARLALALVAWQRPNLLLLDEPSNHLDLEMRHALTVALQGFAGAIIMISHDRHLLSNTVDEFHAIRDGRLVPFDGDLKDYERWLQQVRAEAERKAQGQRPTAAPGETQTNRKQQRQLAAAQREQTADLRKQLRQIEKQMGALELELGQLNEQLADPVLYEDGNRRRLTGLLQRQGEVRQQLSAVEEQWLELGTTLEQAAASP
ncbi:MAG: hypothetical protein RLZZ385_2603 [Pseudomonadota bacterium]|jgi:ATP-binding cassette subfamily F protein 3